ncbi:MULTISPECIES: flagellar basal body P-ring formation chaperone FlgA [Pantoea]|jgi:flagella basal body P-ring formation protein FlgA|uniref:Flagella basal body P-ring formation protein FlgA n=1 Tax=Pantoea brenneri TaxID=472694 RepID=A0A653UMA2_9GAMM|nr:MULTISPECIES: flagellar basal body P-ring formation chaperone FlgA [Pantoea]MBS6032746.1 flagellar basal body P-ring formation protein FlgA [Pantoea sp.]MBZ6395411.1 flagellar basal body P-ring formation protein FlgA [Pantoea sp.]MBZ6437215.1 flagellar basal body P-ring formation protein FlgA [Pantoea sp.]MCQ5471360.1 flagellar basal body P-ring formation protein FlgA [Pantoea brenneri]MDH2123424.1 flagellar basal body P-ring formation chaperone FlgA [Pantoea brenneri]
MRGYQTLLASLLVLIALPVTAGDLSAQLNQFFKARDPQHADGMTVVVRTPQAQWPDCDAPKFTLPGNSRLWGNMSVAANCGENRRYIQVQVQVTGPYLVANRLLTRGSSVSAADFSLQTGRLDTLPARALLNDEAVADAVVLRDIQPGQPINPSMLRQPWRVKAGQSVMVIASGDGFDASGEGKALNNATQSQWVRVRMGNGQVVSGRVRDDGNILITL